MVQGAHEEDVVRLSRLAAVILAPALALAVWGCASAPAPQAEVSPGSEITVKASNFKFDPNTIQMRGTGTVTFVVTNTGGSAHNITIKDPKGTVVDSAEIGPNATVTRTVSFPAPGTYAISCNHPFHTAFGMSGRIIVLAN
jgi:plastocyanin